MDKSHREIRERCLHQMECHGRDIDAVLADFPEHAEQLRPYLQVARSLRCVELRPPRYAAQQGSRQALLDRVAASSSQRHSLTSSWRLHLAPLACALVVFALLAGGVVGTSAAAGQDELLLGILRRLPVGWAADQKLDDTPQATPETGVEDATPVGLGDDPEATERARLGGPPGQQGDPPGQRGEPPGQQGEPPGPRVEPPGQQSEPPGQRSEPPGQQSEPPGQQSEPPGQSGQPPGQSGQSGQSPGHVGTPPCQDGEPPGQDGEPPGQQNSPPGSQGQPQGQQGNPPCQIGGQNPGNGPGQGRSGQINSSDQGGPQGQGKGGPDGGRPADRHMHG